MVDWKQGWTKQEYWSLGVCRCKWYALRHFYSGLLEDRTRGKCILYNRKFSNGLDNLIHRQAFFPSPRNPKEVTSGLFEATACSKLIFSSERQDEATNIKGERADMKTWEIPPLWELLRGRADLFPFSKTFEDVKDESAIIIHSSGSTG